LKDAIVVLYFWENKTRCGLKSMFSRPLQDILA